MITIKELRAKKEPRLTKFCNYLTDLASTYGTDVSRWNISELFGQEIPISPREINKVFFKKVREVEISKKVELSPEVLSLIESQNDNFIKARTKTATNARDAALRQIQHYYNSIEGEMAVLRRADDDIEMIKKSSRLVEILVGVVKTGHFDVSPTLKTTGSCLELHTRSDAVITFRRSDGQVFRLNFGRFLIAIQRESLQLKVFTFKDNIMVGGYYHPFISSSGDVCWGSAKEVAVKNLRELKWDKAFELLWTLLTTYNTSNPYKSMETFFLDGIGPNGEKTPWLKAYTQDELIKFGLHESRIAEILDFSPKKRKKKFVCNNLREDSDGNVYDCDTELYYGEQEECPNCGMSFNNDDDYEVRF